MIATMERMPDELLLQVFDYLSYNELRHVLGTSARWRALGMRCHAFWADIQTPKGLLDAPSHESVVPAHMTLAGRRITHTKGRRFKLRLRSAHPVILAALARHMDNLLHLHAWLDDLKAIEAFVSFMRTVPAPHLLTLLILAARHSTSCFILPNDLFTGSLCPGLVRLFLSNIVQPSHDQGPLSCFVNVVELCLLHTVDFFSSVTPNIFAHFPSLRSLIISAPVTKSRSGFNDMQREIIRRFQTADYSRLTYLGLHEDCWDLAQETSWPLESIPHLFADPSDCNSFPFLPPNRIQRGHIVFEPQGDNPCVIRLGDDDWSFTRAGVAAIRFPETDAQNGLDDRDAAPHLEFHIDEPLAGAIRTVTVYVGTLVRARFVLDDARNLSSLRVIFCPGDALPSMGRFHRLSCPNLRTLVLRGTFESAIRVRVDYAALVKFASSDFESVGFPISLRLENLELDGEPPEEFAKYFCDVKMQDAKTWSYLSVRHVLNNKYTWL